MTMHEPHPWFAPLYRRVLTVAVCVVWLAFELWQQDTLWLLLAAAATAFGLWDLFLSGKYRRRPTDEA